METSPSVWLDSFELVLGSFKVQSKQGKVIEVSEIEEKLERIAERKLEALNAREDTLERLSFRERQGNGGSEALESGQGQQGTCQERVVYILLRLK